jgi:hypothetical protein
MGWRSEQLFFQQWVDALNTKSLKVRGASGGIRTQRLLFTKLWTYCPLTSTDVH